MECYPVLEINLNGIFENAKAIAKLCAEKNILVTGVVKATDSYENSYNKVAEQFIKGGCVSIGDSRINTIKQMLRMGLNAPVMLVRLPMLSEIDEVIEYVDISLNSERKTLELLNNAASKKNKRHKIILMIDLGDLREGFFDEKELLDTAEYVEKKLKSLVLYGVGTNLNCYGSIRPSVENLSRLVNLSEQISERINRKLDIVSGGGTTSLPLIFDNKMPEGINHLRIGEGIVLARDLHDVWGYKEPALNMNNYILKAQIIELKEKPSYPIGERFVDAFGHKPEYEDKGIRKRALLGLGKKDIADIEGLIPKLAGIQLIGGSSDHIILDVTDSQTPLKVGDILEFDLYYISMLHATNCSSVVKKYIIDNK